MKLVLSFLFLAVVVVVGYPFIENENDQIWPIPQKDGTIRYMTEKQALQELSNEPQAPSPRRLDKIQYFLFTKTNPVISQDVEIDNVQSLQKSNFNKDLPTVFMVHGWNGGYWGQQNHKIREAHFFNGDGKNYNFFVVDWSVYAENDNYIAAKMKCITAGKELAKFIDFLHIAGGLSLKSLRLVGHSLGAHVVGFAGKNVQSGKINEIVGLDPAKPLFSYESPSSRLASTDASYVETIQTNGKTLGFFEPIGLASFYPNGGKKQPGCGFDIVGSCSHERAVDYLAEAIASGDNNQFEPTKCDSYEDFNSCKIKVDGIRMGSKENNGKANGIYYLKTNSAPPFAMG